MYGPPRMHISHLFLLPAFVSCKPERGTTCVESEQRSGSALFLFEQRFDESRNCNKRSGTSFLLVFFKLDDLEDDLEESRVSPKYSGEHRLGAHDLDVLREPATNPPRPHSSQCSLHSPPSFRSLLAGRRCLSTSHPIAQRSRPAVGLRAALRVTTRSFQGISERSSLRWGVRTGAKGARAGQATRPRCGTGLTLVVGPYASKRVSAT